MQHPVFLFLFIEKCSKAHIPAGNLLVITFQMEEDEPTGYIRFERFEPVMMKILLERKLAHSFYFLVFIFQYFDAFSSVFRQAF